MKRGIILLTSTSVLLLLGWGLHQSGWLFSTHTESPPAQIKSVDAMDTSSGWRYRQNLPHHWRYIMLQK
jgi:hypothetical protein